MVFAVRGVPRGRKKGLIAAFHLSVIAFSLWGTTNEASVKLDQQESANMKLASQLTKARNNLTDAHTKIVQGESSKATLRKKLTDLQREMTSVQSQVDAPQKANLINSPGNGHRRV